MSPADQPSEEHQVGVTNAQENNPDATIADLTRRMNTEFTAGQYAEAGRTAFEITALSRDELRATFERHYVTVLHLDHEAFGIYEGQIEPTYAGHVDGGREDVLAAAMEFGRRHAQEMVLIAKESRAGDSANDERLGLTILLNETFTIEAALEITATVRSWGFTGATFAPRAHTVAIYRSEEHTSELQSRFG